MRKMTEEGKDPQDPQTKAIALSMAREHYPQGVPTEK